MKPKRLSWLLPAVSNTVNRFARCLNLFNLERMYTFKKSVEVSTMNRVLCDEAMHLTLRDLPSFYACAAGLLSQMTYQLENPDNRNGLLQEALEFCEVPSNQAHHVVEEL